MHLVRGLQALLDLHEQTHVADGVFGICRALTSGTMPGRVRERTAPEASQSLGFDPGARAAFGILRLVLEFLRSLLRVCPPI